MPVPRNGDPKKKRPSKPPQLDSDSFPPVRGETFNLAGPERTEPIRELPPLPSDWDERAAELTDSFLAPRTVTEEERTELTSFVHACLRFSYMEKRVQGDIICELPAHFAVLAGAKHPSLIDEAEEFAETERRNLELDEGPIEDLTEILDDRGIKILSWSRPGIATAGAFLFESDTGPALLSLAPANSPEDRFTLAHAYCHLLADVDPYENRFCPLGQPGSKELLARGGRLLEDAGPDDPFDETSLPELRADLFARAFLVPRSAFTQALQDFGEGGAAGFHPDRLIGVALYFNVTPWVILNRLIDMEILIKPNAAALGRAIDAMMTVENAVRGDSPELLSVLPRRCVNLALALFLKGQVTRGQMRALLDVEEETFERFLAWIEVPPAEEQPTE